MNHEATALHLASGSGVGAMGFDKAVAKLGADSLRFKCVGGVDIDPDACADFEYLTGVPALLADLHQLTPAELRAYVSKCGQREDTPPDVVFTSSPCKGFSRLLPTAKSKESKYQLLNELVYRSIFIACETWSRPPPLLVLENVPGIVSRGKDVLDRAKRILHSYGYFLHEGFHDCGEIGNLAQHRKRYLLVARHPKSVSAFVHKPPKHRVRACGQVLEQLPVPIGPEAADAGAMHALPRIGWLTWVRLALIRAGGDWRDLPAQVGLGVDGSKFGGSPGLYAVRSMQEPFSTVTGSAAVASSNAAAAVADHRIRKFNGSVYGVMPFDQPAGTVQGESLPSNGRFAVADPRLIGISHRPNRFTDQYKMRGWDEPAGVVTGATDSQAGAQHVGDPRVAGFKHQPYSNVHRVESWEAPTRPITSSSRPIGGAVSVADPRIGRSGNKPRFNNNMRVGDWAAPSLCVTPAARPDSGGVSVADPRPRAIYRNETLGVMSWQQAAQTITGSADVQNGRAAVADPRKPLPGPLMVIIAQDGTWHRPITTLEMAMLQSLPARVRGKPLQLAGTSTLGWRERIGNAVPSDAAAAIATSCGLALLASIVGGWFLSSDEIWVRERDHWPELDAYGECVA
jgi:site-specific DNA-cytosine methylase